MVLLRCGCRRRCRCGFFTPIILDGDMDVAVNVERRLRARLLRVLDAGPVAGQEMPAEASTSQSEACFSQVVTAGFNSFRVLLNEPWVHHSRWPTLPTRRFNMPQPLSLGPIPEAQYITLRLVGVAALLLDPDLLFKADRIGYVSKARVAIQQSSNQTVPRPHAINIKYCDVSAAAGQLLGLSYNVFSAKGFVLVGRSECCSRAGSG